MLWCASDLLVLSPTTTVTDTDNSWPGGLGEEARALVKRGEGPARVAPNDGGGEAL